MEKIRKYINKILLFSLFVLPASTNFKLEGFSFGNAGGGQVGSSNYGIVGNIGEVTANKIGSSNYDLGSGLAFVRQSSVPRSPIMINDGNFYNKLKLIVNNTNLAEGSTSFPSSNVLDDFNRANGTIGGAWNGNTGDFSVSSNQLIVNSDNRFVVYDNGVTFGANQEVYVKFVNVSGSANEQDLLIKCQQVNSYDNCTEIIYDATSHKVQVWTSTGGSWTQRGSDIGVTISNGDIFGARANNTGTIEIYKNGQSIGQADYSGWTYANTGGYIGIYVNGATDMVFDDFGGGNVSVGGTGTVELPSDTKFAVAISKDNWATTNYVKNDMTIGGALVMSDYMTYSVWGGAVGTYIIGLDAGTTYAVKVKSMQGQYSESGYGPTATAGTINSTLSFDIDVAATDTQTTPPYIIDFGDLLPGSLKTSINKIWVSFETNAASGGSVFAYGQNGGLYSLSAGYTIPSLSANLASVSNGFGILSAGSTQAAGGPFVVKPLYDGGGDVVGVTDSLVRQLLVSTNPVSSGRASFFVKAKSDNNVVTASDYTETITIIGAANF